MTSPAQESPKPPAPPTDVKPKLKICCACPETKVILILWQPCWDHMFMTAMSPLLLCRNCGMSALLSEVRILAACFPWSRLKIMCFLTNTAWIFWYCIVLVRWRASILQCPHWGPQGMFASWGLRCKFKLSYNSVTSSWKHFYAYKHRSIDHQHCPPCFFAYQ